MNEKFKKAGSVLDTAGLGVGALNPKQQEAFIMMVWDKSILLKMARHETVSQAKTEIEKMWIGEPVTEAVGEGIDSGNLSSPQFSKIDIYCKKLRSAWSLNYEVLQEAINQKKVQSDIMNAMTTRIASDLEMLSIQGDDSLTGTNARQRLLKRCDGFLKQAEEAHIVDVAGGNIHKKVFAQALRSMPDQYLEDPQMKFFCSPSIYIDYADLVADRVSGYGDETLSGKSPLQVYGVPIARIPLIPSSLPVVVSGASAGQCVGTEYQLFIITAGSNDKLLLNIDAGTDRTVTLTAGQRTAAQIAADINAAHADLDGVASVVNDDAGSKIVLKSKTTGASSSVQIKTVADDAYTELGLTVGTYSGAAASGTVYEGSKILLTNPQNLIAVMLDKTRILKEFINRNDRWEFTIYNQVDYKIENLEALVMIKNVRKRSLV